MTRRTEVPAELTGAPLLSRELGSAGIPRSRVRASDVVQPFRGVHVFGRQPAGMLARVEVLAPLLRPGEAFSHTTAARLWGAPVASAHDSRIHVTMAREDQRMRRPGIVGHRAARLPATMLGTLPVVEPAAAWAQCASLLAHDDLVAVGDYLVTPRRVAKKPAITSLEALAAAIPARARGASRARRALEDVRVGSESPMETKLRLLLMRTGLPEPQLNPELIGLHPDLFYPDWRFILEYEGDQHRTDPKQWRRDIWRREAFQAAGYRVMQVHAADVLAEPQQFLARVSRAIAQQQRPS